MSTPDAMTPPASVTAHEIQKHARRLERLKLRRRVMDKRIRQIEEEIRVASRMLLGIVREVTEPKPGDQPVIPADVEPEGLP